MENKPETLKRIRQHYEAMRRKIAQAKAQLGKSAYTLSLHDALPI